MPSPIATQTSLDAADRPAMSHADPVDHMEVRRLYAAGSALMVRRAEDYVPALGVLVRLEAAISHPVSANIFATPAGGQGFPRHCDDENGFTVRFAGGGRVVHLVPRGLSR